MYNQLFSTVIILYSLEASLIRTYCCPQKKEPWMHKKWDLKVLLMVKCVDLCLCATPLISPSRDHRPPVLGQKAAFHPRGLPRVFSRRRWCRRGSSTPAEKWVWSGYIRRCQRNIAHAQLFCTQALLGVMVRSNIIEAILDPD